jgi:uncharacterized phage protein gp47/JayE
MGVSELQTKTFAEIVNQMTTAIQAAAKVNLQEVINLTPGSVTLAEVESVAGVTLWLQGQIVKLLAISRLSTCGGPGASYSPDVDSFIADYDLIRLPAVHTTGNVTVSRFSNTNQAVILIGQQFKSSTTGLVFSAIADSSNPYYISGMSAYVIPSGTSSINVLVQCNTIGSVGNVASGSIDTIVNPIIYVDTVTNTVPFDNGSDEETDDEVKLRFVLYINGLSKATLIALEAALAGLQENIEYNVVENMDYHTDAIRLGYFYAIIDDGSGDPPDSLMTAAYDVLNATRGLTIFFEVYRPVIVQVTVTATITVPIGTDTAPLILSVAEAIESYIASLQIGETFYYSKIEYICYSVSPNVIVNVHSVFLNGGTSDLIVTSKEKIVMETVTILADNP